MMGIGRRLMKINLEVGFRRAKANLVAIRASTKTQVEKAQRAVETSRGSEELQQAEKDLERVTKPLAAAIRRLNEYSPTKEEKNNESERAVYEGREKRTIECAELGGKVCPFTKNGESYNSDKLRDLYKYAGKYTLVLPAFGRNILRSVHVTDVMNLCYNPGISKNDPRIVRHFALARHGEFERRGACNLAKIDNLQDDEGSLGSLLAGILQTQSYASRPLNKEDMRRAHGEALYKILGDSFDADISGAAVVTPVVLFEDGEEIVALRRTEKTSV